MFFVLVGIIIIAGYFFYRLIIEHIDMRIKELKEYLEQNNHHNNDI